MTKETMTIHKALSELKILDVRIKTAIRNSVFCECNKHSNEKINGISVSDFTKEIQGNYDKVVSLIERRKAIKRAVVLSNAETKVKISGKEYTVAEAIEMKNHGIEFDSNLCAAMIDQITQCQAEINVHNGADLDRRAENFVSGIFSGKEGKQNSAEVEKLRKEFIAANSYELIDPIKVHDKIDELEKYINDFKSEVDSALRTSNALTTITIEY